MPRLAVMVARREVYSRHCEARSAVAISVKSPLFPGPRRFARGDGRGAYMLIPSLRDAKCIPVIARREVYSRHCEARSAVAISVKSPLFPGPRRFARGDGRGFIC